ncbi:MAG: peptidoglycan recognition protein family protein [Planctomycetota bacterium]|jgi:N-acetyl-anhydromuramyl-L-alanine amidase AmpD
MVSGRLRIAALCGTLFLWGCLHVQPLPGLVRASDERHHQDIHQDRWVDEGGATAAKPESPAVALPAEVRLPLQREWRHIVLHHSATEIGGADRFDRHHRVVNKWENGLGYHFVIGNGSDTPDGAIEVGARWTRQIQGAHAGVREFNEHGIGICLVGDFRHREPSAKQLAALRALVAELQHRCGITDARIVGHGEIREGTECPGAHFTPAMACGGQHP